MDIIPELLDFEIPGDLAISPDGKSVVYCTTLKFEHHKGKHPTSSIWIADVETEKSARKLTDGSFNDRLPAFSPDGKLIAFLSDRGEPGDACAIHLMNKDGSGIRALTAVKGKRDISKFMFRPRSQKQEIIFLTSLEKPKKTETENDANVWGDWEYDGVWAIDTETWTARSLFSGQVHVLDFCFSPEGDKIAMITSPNPDVESALLAGTTVTVLEIASGYSSELFHIPTDHLMNPVWLTDRFCFISYNDMNDDTSGFGLYYYDFELQKVTKDGSYGEKDCVWGLVVGSRLGPNSQDKNAMLVHVQSGLGDVIRTDSAAYLMGEIKKEILEFVWTADGDGTTVVYAQGSLDKPTEVFARRGDRTLQLSRHGEAWSDKSFGYVNHFKCKTLDEKEMLDYLYITPKQHADEFGLPKHPLPTAVLLHGGPYSRSTDGFDRDSDTHLWALPILSMGFGVLMVNYRGSSGRGMHFAQYAKHGAGKYDEPDVVAATQAAIERGLADQDKLICGGWSQGGYLAYQSAVRNGAHGFGWKFKGLIAGAGVTDWNTMILTSDIGYHEAPLGGGEPWEKDLEENPEQLGQDGSPLWQFKRAKEEGRIPPMLILHGEADERVPVAQAWGFRRALVKAGLPFEMVTYPREGHEFHERAHVVDCLERVVQFAKKHLS